MIKESQVLQGTSGFYVFVKYTFAAQIKLSKGGEVLIDTPLYTSNMEQTYSTGSYKTQAEASSFWNDNKDVIKSNLYKDIIDKSIYSANEYVARKYGFFIAENTEQIKFTNTKKHPEGAIMPDKSSELANKLKALNGCVPLTEAGLSDYITYFAGIPNGYRTESKADVKIRYIAYNNLCVIYLLLDQPEQVIAYADKLIENGFNPKDGEEFKKQAKDLANSFSKSLLKTRQFNTDEYFK